MGGAERTLSYGDGPTGEEPTFVAPYLVLAVECEDPLAPAARLSIAEVEEVELGRGGSRRHARDGEGGRARLRVEVADRWMSGRHGRLRREGERWVLRDDGSKNGTFVGGRRVSEHVLRDGDWIEVGSTFFLFRDQVERRLREPADLAAEPSRAGSDLFTLSPPLARELEALGRVAATPLPILVEGETGSGKEVAARALHRRSGRPGPFIPVNCGALSEGLVESQLFGHRKGAFSGAVDDRPGFVRAADRGTLFLDEIGELSPGAQVKLLRVLQEREVTPVGDARPIPVDLRVVAATHRDLGAMVEEGSFRSDLLARLAGLRLRLPPLRERREDLGVLIGLLLRRIVEDEARDELALERDAARALLTYEWPLNIRELEQALRAACALAGGGRLLLSHLPEALRAQPEQDAGLREELTRLLSAHAGNVSAVSREMGKARVQIRRWCKRFHLDPADFRGS